MGNGVCFRRGGGRGGKVVIVMSYKHELNNTLITSRGTGILNVGAMNDDMY